MTPGVAFTGQSSVVYSSQKVQQLQEVRRVESGQRFQIVYNRVSDNWLWGQPPSHFLWHLLAVFLCTWQTNSPLTTSWYSELSHSGMLTNTNTLPSLLTYANTLPSLLTYANTLPSCGINLVTWNLLCPLYTIRVLTNWLVLHHVYLAFFSHVFSIPQWGAADAEIKVPSGENTELKRSPFKA